MKEKLNEKVYAIPMSRLQRNVQTYSERDFQLRFFKEYLLAWNEEHPFIHLAGSVEDIYGLQLYPIFQSTYIYTMLYF